MNKLRDLVFTALNNAVTNGYAEELSSMTPFEVAGDLIAYDDDIALEADGDEPDYDALQKEIEPLVVEWRNAR